MNVPDTVKLQEIVRANGSSVYHVNIPLDEVQRAELKKGDHLQVISEEIGGLTIKRVD